MSYYRQTQPLPAHNQNPYIGNPPQDSRPMNSMSQHMIQQQQYAMMRGIPYPHPFQSNAPPPTNQPFPIDRILAVMDDHHKEQMAQTKKLEATMKSLISSALEEEKARSQHMAEQLEESFKKQLKLVTKHVDKIEKSLGAPPRGNSLADILASVEFGVEELLERAKDPEAPSTCLPFHPSVTSFLSFV
jgi:hypothetical protein